MWSNTDNQPASLAAAVNTVQTRCCLADQLPMLDCELELLAYYKRIPSSISPNTELPHQFTSNYLRNDIDSTEMSGCVNVQITSEDLSGHNAKIVFFFFIKASGYKQTNKQTKKD